MNEIVNNLILAGEKFLLEMHWKQPGFTYGVCGPNKSCFQHDIAYRDFKDWNRRTTADKVLGDRAFNIAKNPKYDRY